MEFAISAASQKMMSMTPPIETIRLPSMDLKRSMARSHNDLNHDNYNDQNDKGSLPTTAYALHQSIFEGRLKQVNYFLKLGLSANSKDKYGRTSLMIACLCDFEGYGIQVTKALMRYGADINIKDSLGQSVAYIAVTEKRETFFNFLIDNYSISIDYKQKDNDGNCLINHIALHGSSQMIRKVIHIMKERRLEIDQRNNSGYSALLLALKNDNFLNAFILVKEGHSSPSLQDHVRYFNALEWLMDRIRLNKNFILSNRLKRMRDHLSKNTHYDMHSVSPPSTNRQLRHMKSFTSSNCNQYFQTDGMCDHTVSPNYSVDHHKSRYVPMILQSRYLAKLRHSNSCREERTMSTLVTSRNGQTPTKDEENIMNDFMVDENTDIKDLIQKLYEIIYIKMSESYRAKQFYNSGLNKPQSPLEHEKKENKPSKRTNSRSQSQNKKTNETSKLGEKQEAEQIMSTSTKSIENQFEQNIFNMEKHRKTPKLIAIRPAEIDEQSTKEAVHNMLSLYVSNQALGGESGKNSSLTQDGWGHVSPFEKTENSAMKSKRNSLIGNKEKSNVSEKSRNRSMVSASSHVHFN